MTYFSSFPHGACPGFSRATPAKWTFGCTKIELTELNGKSLAREVKTCSLSVLKPWKVHTENGIILVICCDASQKTTFHRANKHIHC